MHMGAIDLTGSSCKNEKKDRDVRVRRKPMSTLDRRIIRFDSIDVPHAALGRRLEALHHNADALTFLAVSEKSAVPSHNETNSVHHLLFALEARDIIGSIAGAVENNLETEKTILCCRYGSKGWSSLSATQRCVPLLSDRYGGPFRSSTEHCHVRTLGAFWYILDVRHLHSYGY
jgi:hypothetical protein